MNFIAIFLIGLGLLAAGLLGITWSIPLQAPALVLIGASGIFAAMSLWRAQPNKRPDKTRDPVGSWLPYLAIVAILFFAARAYWSPVRDLGIEDLILILPAGLLYLIVGYSAEGKAGISLRVSIAWVVIFLLLLHAGSCLMQLNGSEGYSLAMYLSESSRSDVTKIAGMYAYYGSFANFAVMAGLLCLSLGVWGRYKYGVRTFIFILGLFALGLALWSQSRSAALSLCPALFVFVILVYGSLSKQANRVKVWTRRILFLLGITGCAAVVFGGFWVFSQRGADSLKAVFESGVRIPLWAMAFEQWSDYKLLGAGGRSFSYECSAYWSDGLNSGERSPEFVHNEYLQVLADYGLVGFILLMGLLFSHLVVGMKQVHRLSDKVADCSLQQGSNAMALAIAGTSGMVAMAIHACFDFPMHILPNLLLVSCCAAWILPLPVLRQKGQATEVATKTKSLMPKLRSLVLMILSMGTIGLGAHQWWAGAPLIENKMVKEHGSWNPEEVDLKTWIPAVEESLERAPQWRRYERLGTLYRVSATRANSPEDQQELMNLAEDCYLASMERHPFDLISQLNLASLYTEQKRWNDANKVYSEIPEFVRARERSFRVHKKWADMHLLWADDLMDKQNSKEVEKHLAEAKRLYNASYDYALYYNSNYWVSEYTRLLIGYATFLGHEARYQEAEALFDEAKQQEGWFQKQALTKLNLYYGKHLHAYGRYLWHQRKPEEAYGLMMEAKEALQQHKKFMKGEVGEMWREAMHQVEEMIQFFRETGINKKVRGKK